MASFNVSILFETPPLQQSTATWNVLGQQILMSKMFVPAELLMSLAEITAGNPSPETLSKIQFLRNIRKSNFMNN